MIRVLIVDDHRLVRQGMTALLSGATDIEIAGEARDGYSAVQMTTELFPDIVLMDADMPRLNGFQATRIIRSSGLRTRVIIVTGFSDEEMQVKAKESGADAYLLKEGTREQLLDTIRSVYSGALAPDV